MNTTVSRLVAAAALLALAACSPEPDGAKEKGSDRPKDVEKLKNTDLLAPPKDGQNVFKSGKTAKDFPGLRIKTLKAGAGEETLDWGEIGVLHVIGKLSSGKEYKNTKKTETPVELLMMEWGDIQGLVVGALGMKKGEKRTLEIPASFAYGEAGSLSDGVPPHASLSLRIELTDIKPGLDEEFKVVRYPGATGKGEPARVGQTGMLRYTGILAEGDDAGLIFDGNRQPDKQPIAMQIGVPGGLIEGWIKGGLGMRVGEKRWLKIPAKMAYGDRANGDIPAGATLIFEIELVEIQG